MPRPSAPRGARNLATGLRQRVAAGCPMAAFDRLPPPLRKWLAQAVLPWSPDSALRVWARAGDVQTALARLERAQAATLRRDAMARRP